ncbi:hypothetical protein EsDP_00005056 [Epichloe bromicola]|uniref:C2H2-type domain-containing protein n=1 Tax=Epichloe bromicola TaxID=79588 RepID=A0ABQ0CTN8_9HYPO
MTGVSCQGDAAASPTQSYPTPTPTPMPADHEDFACHGELMSGGRWGCGRRFNSLHKFARHLRTPTGRRCIQPLYDEERNMKQQWIPPQTQQHTPADSVSPEAYMVDDPTIEAMHSQTQSQPYPIDFSFTSFAGHYDSEGSPHMHMDMEADEIYATLQLLDDDQATRGVTVPGTSYMAWWQSYMGSISTSNHLGGLASITL